MGSSERNRHGIDSDSNKENMMPRNFNLRSQDNLPREKTVYDMQYFYGNLLEENGMFLKPDPVDPADPSMIPWGIPRVTESTFYFPDERVRKPRRLIDAQSSSDTIDEDTHMDSDIDSLGDESDVEEENDDFTEDFDAENNQCRNTDAEKSKLLSDDDIDPETTCDSRSSLGVSNPSRIPCPFENCERSYVHKSSLGRHLKEQHKKTRVPNGNIQAEPPGSTRVGADDGNNNNRNPGAFKYTWDAITRTCLSVPLATAAEHINLKIPSADTSDVSMKDANHKGRGEGNNSFIAVPTSKMDWCSFTVVNRVCRKLTHRSCERLFKEVLLMTSKEFFVLTLAVSRRFR
ncbi:hypothetical protein FO519_005677 [Halicephalobus sp. NKZ332]|nr:hypothetical protein FO519_005677 [Halicephalobus sp. NKZ332]